MVIQTLLSPSEFIAGEYQDREDDKTANGGTGYLKIFYLLKGFLPIIKKEFPSDLHLINGMLSDR